jgi:hypothetical protein
MKFHVKEKMFWKHLSDVLKCFDLHKDCKVSNSQIAVLIPNIFHVLKHFVGLGLANFEQI